MSPTTIAIDVTDRSFETDVLLASHERPVVVDFWAEWCGPCRALGPVLEAAVARHGGVTLAKLDTDANPETTAAYGIRGIPVVKAFLDGGVVAEFVGLQPANKVEQFLQSLAPPPAVELPGDEAGLRAVLEGDPDNIVARRVLGRLLLDGGDLDGADAVLPAAPADPIADGLRARIDLLRAGDGALLPINGNDVQALPDVIAALRASSDPQKTQLRRVVVGIIESERERDPSVERYRAELASALF